VTVPDITLLPFFTTISPYIAKGVIKNPQTGRDLTFLSRKVLKENTFPTGELGDLAPIPEDSIVTLLAGGFIAQGFGIPCSVLNAIGAPANDPRRAHCDQPLPDDANPATGTPGVVLYPDEVASIKARTEQINAAISQVAGANGYKVFDSGAAFTDVAQNGRHFGGVTVTTSFLTGGLFGYDGIHPTSLGYAIVAEEMIKFINANFGNHIPDINFSPYLFQGNTSGGYPHSAALTDDESLAAASQIYDAPGWRSMATVLSASPGELAVGNTQPIVAREKGDSKQGEKGRD